MPEPATIERARKDAREGKSASTQAGEFVREEFHHLREGKHGARSPQQAIAIGLSKARRAGVTLAPPKRGKTSEKVRRQAARDLAKSRAGNGHVSRRRSRAVTAALQHEGRAAGSRAALSRHSRAVAARRTSRERTAATRRAVRTRPEHEMS